MFILLGVVVGVVVIGIGVVVLLLWRGPWIRT